MSRKTWLFNKAKSEMNELAKISFETICPLCLDRFSPGEILVEYPFCPDCSSEGMDLDVERFDDFVKSKSQSDIDDMIARWDAAEGFLPSYKATKRIRMIKLRELVTKSKC